jgi:hypothetical protein
VRRLCLRLTPLWVWRLIPTRVKYWVFREELARGQEYMDSVGWTDEG